MRLAKTARKSKLSTSRWAFFLSPSQVLSFAQDDFVIQDDVLELVFFT